MNKRTLKSIELDVKRIQEAARTATSMKQLCAMVGLTASEVATSLSRHPRIKKWVHEDVKRNNAFKKQILKEERACACESGKKSDEKAAPATTPYGVVIDASIANMDFIHELLMDICPEGGKVILTRQTIWELSQMMQGNDDYAVGASIIIKLLKESPRFEGWRTEETDDTIVDFCAKNSQSVMLFTSDFDMYRRACNRCVRVKYIRKITSETHQHKKEKDILHEPEDVVFCTFCQKLLTKY